MIDKKIVKTFRVNREEEKELQEKAKALNMKESEYIRFAISHKPDDYPEIRILLGRLINEINHIGVNINQIVKRHNSGEYQEGDKVRLEAYLRKINDTLQEAVVELGNK